MDEADLERERERDLECWGSSRLRSFSRSASFFSFRFLYWLMPIAAAAVPAATPAMSRTRLLLRDFFFRVSCSEELSEECRRRPLRERCSLVAPYAAPAPAAAAGS
jgi:hypothetical protein